jgi:diaminopimelate epimerase
MRFAKGHGTGNDFVVLPDPDGTLELTPELVARLCDRRFGIGGDGVLRVVRCAKHPDSVEYAGDAEWFMDYHNADGSLAEMCGNGVRVFARYLVETGLAGSSATSGSGPAGSPVVIPIATRAGLVSAIVDAAEVTVDMPRPRLGASSMARLHASTFAGTAVNIGNPHLVCPVSDESTLDELDLSTAPELDTAVFPAGGNVEFYANVVPGSWVRMRVHERGAAETHSCGSGACAVAAVVLHAAGRDSGRIAVDLPGGRLMVTLYPDSCRLTGPAVIVASGDWHGTVA